MGEVKLGTKASCRREETVAERFCAFQRDAREEEETGCGQEGYQVEGLMGRWMTFPLYSFIGDGANMYFKKRGSYTQGMLCTV